VTKDRQISTAPQGRRLGRARRLLRVHRPVQHMMFRFLDPKHPLYTAEGAAKWAARSLAPTSRWMRSWGHDGEAAQGRPPHRLRHGFASFRRGMNYNTGCEEQLHGADREDTKRKNLEDPSTRGTLRQRRLVEDPRLRPRAGQVYLNLAGRERGIVQPGETTRSWRRRSRRPRSLRRPRDGQHPVQHVLHPRRGYAPMTRS